MARGEEPRRKVLDALRAEVCATTFFLECCCVLLEPVRRLVSDGERRATYSSRCPLDQMKLEKVEAEISRGTEAVKQAT